MARAELERRNPNYVGGDINGGVQDLLQLFTRPCRAGPLLDPGRRALPLLLVDPAGRRRARHVRLLRGPRRAAGGAQEILMGCSDEPLQVVERFVAAVEARDDEIFDPLLAEDSSRSSCGPTDLRRELKAGRQ